MQSWTYAEALAEVETLTDMGGPFGGLSIGPLTSVSGAATRAVNLTSAACWNRTTNEMTAAPVRAAIAWDCEAGGLTVNAGDVVDVFLDLERAPRPRPGSGLADSSVEPGWSR